MLDLRHTINHIGGFRASGIAANLKVPDKLDMALVVADRPCVAAGVFTQNSFKAAPVLVNQSHLGIATDRIRAVIINTVNANAGTGQKGLADAKRMAELTAADIGCKTEQVLVLSTGVIGQHLNMSKIEAGIHSAAQSLGRHWEDAARGIMTTDTRPKLASTIVHNTDGDYTIAGITKGSGMIAPNMATTLGILMTDVKLTHQQAQQALSYANTHSYNHIVVDGDTSPSDTIFLLSSGASGVSLDDEVDFEEFKAALTQVMIQLAQSIVMDGEGATKFITIDVHNAPSDEDASKIAHTIATSPLVKTAFYGNDANWGRIIAAAGRAGITLDFSKSELWMNHGKKLTDNQRGLLLFQDGTPATYDEDVATTIIKHDSIYVTLDLCVGEGQATVWTCDLSHDYVSINADYRT